MPRITITVPGDHPKPYEVPLDRPIVTFGRSEGNDIIIDSGSVSTRHAELRLIDGAYEIVNCGSTNGIKLKGLPEEVIPLANDVIVKLGDAVLLFEITLEEIQKLSEMAKNGQNKETSPKVEAITETEPETPQKITLKSAEQLEKKVALAAARVAAKSEEKSEPEPAAPEATVSKKFKSAAGSSRSPVTRTTPVAKSKGVPLILGVLIIVGAFCSGLELRYKREVGASLFSTLMDKEESKEEAKETPEK